MPARVLSVRDGAAVVEVRGRRQVASAAAVPAVEPGDWVILSAGVLVRVLDPASARVLAEAFNVATSADRRADHPAPAIGQGGEP